MLQHNGGTQTFWMPGRPKARDLAERLFNQLAQYSPGTLHEVMDDRPGLYELNSTNMPAAYLEAEFHDWWPGKGWLQNSHEWAWKVGVAVDVNMGYP